MQFDCLGEMALHHIKAFRQFLGGDLQQELRLGVAVAKGALAAGFDERLVENDIHGFAVLITQKSDRNETRPAVKSTSWRVMGQKIRDGGWPKGCGEA